MKLSKPKKWESYQYGFYKILNSNKFDIYKIAVSSEKKYKYIIHEELLTKTRVEG